MNGLPRFARNDGSGAIAVTTKYRLGAHGD